MCTAHENGMKRAVWRCEPAGRPDGSQHQTDFTASRRCAPMQCCAAAQRAAMGSLRLSAHRSHPDFGAWHLASDCVCGVSRRGVQVNVPALVVLFRRNGGM